jgi:excisionase family DNA binding protein
MAKTEPGGRAFLTLAEAAAEIGCTRRFLEMRIEDGELKVFRPSTRLVRVRRAELEKWIERYSFGGNDR